MMIHDEQDELISISHWNWIELLVLTTLLLWQLMKFQLRPLKLLQSLFCFHLLLINVLPELPFPYVKFLKFLWVIILNSIQRFLIEAKFFLKESSLMTLGLNNISKEGETIGFDAFITLFVEVIKGLVTGSPLLSINDVVILFPDFKDWADDILIDHGVDVVVDTVHEFIQSLVFGSSNFFLQLLVFLNHDLLHSFLLLHLLTQGISIEILQNFDQQLVGLYFKPFQINLSRFPTFVWLQKFFEIFQTSFFNSRWFCPAN